MNRSLLLVLTVISGFFVSTTLSGQEPTPQASVLELRAALKSIRPYLPVKEIGSDIDIFGSTSMDSMAHGWANGFAQFHPKAKVIISAEGSESVFDRLAKHPGSIGMLSRPVTAADLEQLKKLGLKQPVAIMVGRDPLAVFVHESNPLPSISYAELVALFCGASGSERPTWGSIGATGDFAGKPVMLLGRDASSGTRKFVSDFVFAGKVMRSAVTTAKSNAKLIAELEQQPTAIAISNMKCGSHDARMLPLRANQELIPSDEQAVLLGKYPLIRPLTLVFDLGQPEASTDANREFVRYALSHAGQVQVVLSGFFPFDPPTLRAELMKVDFPAAAVPLTPGEKQGAQAKSKSAKPRVSR